MPKTYRIGELADALTVPIETIRYYEKEGLLPEPARSGGNYRLYTDAQRQRLGFVLHCRALDMTLGEVRQLLSLRDDPSQGCAEVNEVIDQHIGHVAERLQALRALQLELKAIRVRCSTEGSAAKCGILEAISEGPRKSRSRTKVGVHTRKLGA